jgi:16S rRNA (cytosine1402-N4)-methyltransferase
VASADRHRTVLLAEAVDALAVKKDGTYVDATFGRGGHARAILDRLSATGRLIAMDRDPDAILASQGMADARFSAHQARFGELAAVVREAGVGRVDGVLFDLGVSSPQIDRAERGFSFRADGPLDMRMNPGAGETAAELIDRLEESELADLIYVYGQERLSRRIARRIVELRPWSGPKAGEGRGTAALAYLVAGCYPPKARRGRIHPATRTFQALRIAVNDELGALDQLLHRAPDWLVPGGLFAVISFHSLEDRRVKTTFLADERLERITRKPLVADPAEQEANPRSRSAKLRVARRRPLAAESMP